MFDISQLVVSIIYSINLKFYLIFNLYTHQEQCLVTLTSGQVHKVDLINWLTLKNGWTIFFTYALTMQNCQKKIETILSFVVNFWDKWIGTMYLVHQIVVSIWYENAFLLLLMNLVVLQFATTCCRSRKIIIQIAISPI